MTGATNTPQAVAASDPNLFNFEGPDDPSNPWGTDYLTGGCHAVVVQVDADKVPTLLATALGWETARSH